MATKIVNFKDYTGRTGKDGKAISPQRALDDEFGPQNWYYIGRAMKRYGLEASPLANPHKVKKDSGRAAAIKDFNQYAWDKVRAQDADFMAGLCLLDMAAVGVCWCAPKLCHGHSLLSITDWCKKNGILRREPLPGLASHATEPGIDEDELALYEPQPQYHITEMRLS